MVETTARQVVQSILILGAILTGCFTLIGFSLQSENVNYGVSNKSLNKFTAIKADADKIKENFPDAQPSSGVLGILNGLIEVSWGAIKAVWDSYSTVTSLINDLTEGALGFDLPSWFSGLILSIIGVTIAFALMAAWFKWHI